MIVITIERLSYFILSALIICQKSGFASGNFFNEENYTLTSLYIKNHYRDSKLTDSWLIGPRFVLLINRSAKFKYTHRILHYISVLFSSDLIQVLWIYFYGTKQFLARKCGIMSSFKRRFGVIRKRNHTNDFTDVKWPKKS